MTLTRPSPADAQVIIAALKNRRTCRTFTAEPVARVVIEDLLEAARWAPNHRLTNPWRFFVLEKGSAARAQVAEAVRAWTYEYVTNPTAERRTESADAAKQEILDAPALIYAFSLPGRDEEVTTENYAATCCAIQNMQLAAYAHGLAIGWSTGKPAKSAEIPRILGADPTWRLVGALFCGVPAIEMRQERKPLTDVVSWA